MKLLDWGQEGTRTEAEIAKLRDDFLLEVSVWQKLDHPNVATVNFPLVSFYANRFVWSLICLFALYPSTCISTNFSSNLLLWLIIDFGSNEK